MNNIEVNIDDFKTLEVLEFDIETELNDDGRFFVLLFKDKSDFEHASEKINSNGFAGSGIASCVRQPEGKSLSIVYKGKKDSIRFLLFLNFGDLINNPAHLAGMIAHELVHGFTPVETLEYITIPDIASQSSEEKLATAVGDFTTIVLSKVVEFTNSLGSKSTEDS